MEGFLTNGGLSSIIPQKETNIWLFVGLTKRNAIA